MTITLLSIQDIYINLVLLLNMHSIFICSPNLNMGYYWIILLTLLIVTHCAWLSHLFSLFKYKTADLAKLFRRLSHIWDLSECSFFFFFKFSLKSPRFDWRKTKWVTYMLIAKKRGEIPVLSAGSDLCHPACSLSRVESTVPKPVVTQGWVFLVMEKQLQGVFLGRLLHSPFGGCSLGQRSGMAFLVA